MWLALLRANVFLRYVLFGKLEWSASHIPKGGVGKFIKPPSGANSTALLQPESSYPACSQPVAGAGFAGADFHVPSVISKLQTPQF